MMKDIDMNKEKNLIHTLNNIFYSSSDYSWQNKLYR